MFVVHCPVTGTDELVSVLDIRSMTNTPTGIRLTVACACGQTHAYRTGRRRAAGPTARPAVARSAA